MTMVPSEAANEGGEESKAVRKVKMRTFPATALQAGSVAEL